MRTRKILPLLMMGLLMCSFMTTSVAATGRPTYALDQGDVQGWWRYDEGLTVNIIWSGYNLSMWWQIWINNQTAQVNASAAWANATKAICIILITFPEDIESDWWFALKIWFQITTYTNVDIDGLDHDIMWNENGINLAIATEDEELILMLGYNETSAPADPFTRWWAVKTPTNSSAVTAGDIEFMLEAQGSMLEGIPGFEISLVGVTLALLIGIIFQFKRKRSSIEKYRR